MRLVVRFVMAAVVAVGLIGPAGPAEASGKGHHRFSALVFSKTAAFRHDSIPAAVAAIQQLGARHHFRVDATEDAAAFTDRNLARYDVVVWVSTTGDVLDEPQQAAFERYIRRGGGYAGIHAASDTEYDWAWYGGLVGAYFRDHPGSVNAQFQVATLKVLTRDTAATRPLPRTWQREEEWYNFRTNPRDTVRVLAEVDESTYDPRGYSEPGGSPGMGRHHPIAWCQPYDSGRAFYTAMGHKAEYWSDPLLLAHVLGGIRMAAGVTGFPCGRED
ncbi:ThuA domain-containing protein [Actinoplanes sp. LDG1-06]|uniref:ThuA domain-containing protein n=1 Tax=Paractinoplanes ovalisporus TaxID=2810368 RepID=A0ABS2ALJ2_9ACTN|nr:ThuA domain-containing protein [Actinoplanes ovalisporus]MBM2620711.1 ThuA domain-containing protein [Actinoplanes ovalisporus]